MIPTKHEHNDQHQDTDEPYYRIHLDVRSNHGVDIHQIPAHHIRQLRRHNKPENEHNRTHETLQQNVYP